LRAGPTASEEDFWERGEKSYEIKVIADRGGVEGKTGGQRIGKWWRRRGEKMRRRSANMEETGEAW